MTSYDFEKAAKEALISTIEEKYGEKYGIENISMVWFAHILGNKKAILIDDGDNKRIYEVTYSLANDQMYVDVYEKQLNKTVSTARRGM